MQTTKTDRRRSCLRATTFAAVLAATALTACAPDAAAPAASSDSGAPAPVSSPTVPPATSPPVTSSPAASAPVDSPSGPATQTPSAAAATLATLSLEQRVGQVLMVSSPVTGADAASLYPIDSLFVGNVFMKGRSTSGTEDIQAKVSEVTAHFGAQRAQPIRPFVATDQEGGMVQIMRGPGFADMPQAIEQAGLAPEALELAATSWGQQLAAVGVNVNLAPVLDTVTSAAFAPQNAPIGTFGREYGYTPQQVSSHGLAFARGMQAAGVAPTVKHFPGLGRVTLNTDVSGGVSDPVMTRQDPYLAPFQDAVAAGVPWLMVSNALYPAIDPNNLAVFSPTIVQDMIRDDLGFTGIIVSDDICDAVAVAATPVDQRGVAFLAAGGTMVLCTNSTLMPQLQQGLLTAAQSDPAVAAQVDAAALIVLEAKLAAGLLD